MDEDESELELGLGLSLRSGGGGGVVKIMSAKDFGTSCTSGGGGGGTKRGAHCIGPRPGYSASPLVRNSCQVVGWPPIRTYRMNSLLNQKPANGDQEDKGAAGRKGDTSEEKINNGSNNDDTMVKERAHFRFVKVNMDGLQIGRKVDLNAHSCYETLAKTLEDMFVGSSTIINSMRPCGVNKQTIQHSKLLDGSSEFVLTYEDKEGDWMLVGDVPWGMFLTTAKRLRIMKTSDSNGLGFQGLEKHTRQT